MACLLFNIRVSDIRQMIISCFAAGRKLHARFILIIIYYMWRLAWFWWYCSVNMPFWWCKKNAGRDWYDWAFDDILAIFIFTAHIMTIAIRFPVLYFLPQGVIYIYIFWVELDFCFYTASRILPAIKPPLPCSLSKAAPNGSQHEHFSASICLFRFFAWPYINFTAFSDISFMFWFRAAYGARPAAI